jgi:hypothetical protein
VFYVEDVRVAIAIGSARHAIRATVRPKGPNCILYVIVNQPAPRTKLFLFLLTDIHILRKKS